MPKSRPEKPPAPVGKQAVDAQLKAAFQKVEATPPPEALKDHIDKLILPRRDSRS